MELLHSQVDRGRPFTENTPHPIDGLRQDHARLCGELDVLKKAESGDTTHLWQTLRDVCSRLSIGLLEHIRREERLVVTRNRSLGAAAPETVIGPSVQHYSDYHYLQVLTRCIASEKRPFLINSRYQLLTDFLQGLHRHMDQQETELFPVIERAMAGETGAMAWTR